MDNVPFPFLSLPQKAQTNVLKTMRVLEIVSFSFCSKRTKAQVISLKLTSRTVFIRVGRDIEATVFLDNDWYSFEFYGGKNVEETDEFIPLPIPNTVDITYSFDSEDFYSETVKSSMPEYEFKDWIEHVFAVFNNTKIDELMFDTACDRFDVNSIADTFKAYTIVRLVIDFIDETQWRARIAAQKALEVIDNTNELYVLSKTCSIQKMLMRNYDKFRGCPSITLNDLLMINSVSIGFYSCNLSELVVNRFLKLWIRGGNPRLEHLKLHFSNERNGEEILKSIGYRKIPDKRRRVLRTTNRRHRVRGGYDIMRHDGTVATISVENSRGRCLMNMYVRLK